MRRFTALLLTLVMVVSMTVTVSAEQSEVTVLYTNDVHSYITEDITYSRLAGLKESLENVLLVDAGDHIQGTAYGSMDSGKTIIDLMNAAGYDLATLGNHEFDYGMEGCMNVIEWANFPYVSCNFYHEKDGVVGNPVLDPYKVFEVGGVKVAFIGITTPESFTKSTPAYFQDENGNYIYGISAGEDGAELYAVVQYAIDLASEEADYVIALGHLGDDLASDPWNSEDVIANTSGLDAFIDGHSHSVVPMKEVADKNGDAVVLTQTGEYFGSIGKLTIAADGKISAELLDIEDVDDVALDEEVKAIEDKWVEKIEADLNRVVGYADLTFDNYDANGKRLVRMQSTNTGDFAADALYYLFDNMDMDVDVAIMNGGGVRNKAISGWLTYLSCKDIHTFGNVACLQTITGQQLLDALEWGSRDIDPKHEKESGGFLHTSGVKYEINSYIPSTVQMDDKGVWTGGPTGEYRVKNVQVLNNETGVYEPLDLDAKYNLAGYNYTLRDLGDGFAMFNGAVNVLDYVMTDYMVLANYIASFPKQDIEGTAYPVIGADSVYANIEGSGRIAINHEPYTDVNSGDWFADYVAALSYEGVIGGMTATTYEPSGTLTNGQALALLMRAHGEEVAQGEGANWAAGYIEKAVELGLTEEPLAQDEAISRGAFCDIAAKLYGLTGAPEQNKFTDTDDAEVLALVAAGVIDGFAEDDGTYTFRADDTLIRSQIAKIIYCLKNLAA